MMNDFERREKAFEFFKGWVSNLDLNTFSTLFGLYTSIDIAAERMMYATIKTFNTIEAFDEWLSNQITKRENAKEPNTTSNTSTETN